MMIKVHSPIQYAITTNEIARKYANVLPVTWTFCHSCPLVYSSSAGGGLMSNYGPYAYAVLAPTSVSAITLVSGGSGYTNAPTVNIGPPVISGGVQATATAVISGGQVTGVIITDPGSGYMWPSPPSVSFSGGGVTNANASATLAPTSVLRIDVTNGGSGYLSRVTISPALSSAVPRFAGIRPAVEPTTYQVDRRYLPNAFGRAPDGSDGGAFIEFKDVPANPYQNVPKYTAFPDHIEWLRFSNYWFDNSAHRTNNVLHHLAANQTFRSSIGGWSYSVNENHSGKSLSVVFVGVLPSDISREEASVHEIGHRFGLIPDYYGYIDTNSNVLNHEATDRCVMSYNNNWFNGISEFSIDALINGQGGNPGLRSFDDK